MAPAPKGKTPYEGLRSAGLLLAIPALLIVSPLVGLFLGMQADRWLKTGRTFTAIGIILGFVAGGYEIYEIYRRYQAEEEERNRRP